jgi:hypothetical protein
MADNNTKYQKLYENVVELLSFLFKKENFSIKHLDTNTHILEQIAYILDICIDKVFKGEENNKYKTSIHLSVCCFNTSQQPEDIEILYYVERRISIHLIETVLKIEKEK